MQSGSFVNLSRLRKEQAAARALQEQQQQQAAALARAQQESLASLPPPPPSATPHEYGSSGGQSYQGQYAPYLSTSAGSGSGNGGGGGGSSSTTSSSTGHSPLASPPPAVTSSPGGPASYLGSSHDSPSLLSPQDASFPSASSSNGSGGNGNAGFSLVRRHHTVGSRPQKYLSATQKERLDEEDAEGGLRADGDDFDDSGSTGAVEGSFDGHGAVGHNESGAAGLSRAGSLPSKPSGASPRCLFLLSNPQLTTLPPGSRSPASYIQSSGSISRSQGVKRRPSLGAARLDTIPASGSLYAGSPSPDPKSPPADGSYDDDVEWERALAQSRKGGHHSVSPPCASSCASAGRT